MVSRNSADTHCPPLVPGPSAGWLQRGLVLTAACRHRVARATHGHRSAAGTAPLTKAPLQTHRLKESVAPVLSVLTECARLHRPARKFLKAQVRQGVAEGPHSLEPLPARLRDVCLPRCCHH